MLIVGDTFEIRDRLREMGCRWDADARAWSAPDASVLAEARALADAEPLRKWNEYANGLAWCPGSFTPVAFEAALRACSLGMSLAHAKEVIAARIIAGGGKVTPAWMERNVGHAYAKATPPEWMTGGNRGGAETRRSERGTEEGVKEVEKPRFLESKLAEFAGSFREIIDTAWLADRSPVDPTETDAHGFLAALYEPGEFVAVLDVFASQGQWMWSHASGFAPSRIDYRAWDGNDGAHESAPPTGAGAAFRAAGPLGIWYLCNPLDGSWHRTGESDAKERPKWSRRSEPSVTAMRYFVLESDSADPREWVAALAQLPLRIAAIYTSGGKSIHFLIRVDAGSKAQFDEWRATAKRVMIPLGADPGCMSAVRLTRLPGCLREGKEDKTTGQVVSYPRPKLQKLLYLDPAPIAGKLVDRAAVRDTLGVWERWVEGFAKGEIEADGEALAQVRRALGRFAGARADRCRGILTAETRSRGEGDGE